MYTKYKSPIDRQLQAQQEKRDVAMSIHKTFIKDLQQGNLYGVKNYLETVKDNLILDYPVSKYDSKPPYSWEESDGLREVLSEAIAMVIMKEGKQSSLEILSLLLEHLGQTGYEMQSFLNSSERSARLMNVFNSNNQPFNKVALEAITILTKAGWNLTANSINVEPTPWCLQGNSNSKPKI